MVNTTISVGDNLSYEDVLKLFRESEDPVLTAVEVADAFDISSQAANKRLKRLENRGELKRKRVGAAAVVYWLPGSADD